MALLATITTDVTNNTGIAPLETEFSVSLDMPDEIVETSNDNLITELSSSDDLIMEV